MSEVLEIIENPKSPSFPDAVIELTQSKYPRLSRRQFLKLTAILAGAGLIKRIIDIETLDWKNYSYSKTELMNAAMKYQKAFNFGVYPDFEGNDPWTNTNLLRDAIGFQNKIGTFLNLEWTDEQSYPGKLDHAIELLYEINSRNAQPLISLHTALRPNGSHIFSDSNANWLRTHIELMMKKLNAEFPFPLEIRSFYEADIDSRFAFSYGPSNDLHGAAHQEGFKRAARMLSNANDMTNYRRDIGMCLSVFCSDIQGYWIPQDGGSRIFDAAGLDGYDIFPGRLSDWVDEDIPFDGWVTLLGYYMLGKRSPEQVFEGGLRTLAELTRGEVPFHIYEIGSKQGDIEWIDHAFWLLAALGGDGAYPFIYDKQYQIKKYNKPYEADWSRNLGRGAEVYAQSLHVLNSRANIQR